MHDRARQKWMDETSEQFRVDTMNSFSSLAIFVLLAERCDRMDDPRAAREDIISLWKETVTSNVRCNIDNSGAAARGDVSDQDLLIKIAESAIQENEATIRNAIKVRN